MAEEVRWVRGLPDITQEDVATWVMPSLLEEKARQNRDKTFLMFGGGTGRGPELDEWSYEETDRMANRVGNGLARLGVSKGDRVAIYMPNCYHFHFFWFGTHKIGAVQVPINIAYKGEFLSHTINVSGAKVVVVSDDLADRVAFIQNDIPQVERVVVWSREGRSFDEFGITAKELIPIESIYEAPDDPPGVEVNWYDMERVMFTSGTTGRSKGVLRAHAAAYMSARNYVNVCRVTSDDVLMTALPAFHANHQVLCVFPALLADAKAAVYPRFSATRMWDWARECGATMFNVLGVMSYFLWNQPPRDDDADNPVRIIMAAPAPKDVYWDFMKRFNIDFVDGYGLTETGMVTYVPPDQHRDDKGIIGLAVPGYDVRILDEYEREVPRGEQGEICIRNELPYLMVTEYIGMPEKTVEDFRNLWFHTGDWGRQDEDGFFYFVDRKKDYIRRRAENVSSREVERIVNNHPAVQESAAIGVPAGPEAGAEDEIKIVVVKGPGKELDYIELMDWCNERMPYFMVPRYVEFVDALPKTPTDRVQKFKLREQGITPNTWDRESVGYKVTR